MEEIGKFFDMIRDFIIEQGENPWFWIIIFVAGLLIGTWAIRALNKD